MLDLWEPPEPDIHRKATTITDPTITSSPDDVSLAPRRTEDQGCPVRELTSVVSAVSSAA
jgi:hypothetical protein